MPGPSSSYLVVWWYDAAAKDTSRRVSPSFVRGALDGWLRSRRQSLREIYVALEGGRSTNLSAAGRDIRDEQLKKSIGEAFLAGKLVALSLDSSAISSKASTQRGNPVLGGVPSDKPSEGEARLVSQLPAEGEYVGEIGIVSWDGTSELRLRSSPKTGNNVIGNLAFNTHVQVIKRLSGGWLYVSTRDGLMGYVATEYIWCAPVHPLPEPNVLLQRVAPGRPGYAISIAKQHYSQSVKWGQDLRFYVAVLALVNRRPLPPFVEGWKTLQFTAGEFIWVPSPVFAKAMRGKVSSGSYTYEVAEALGIADAIERVGQLQADLRKAIQLSLQYIPQAVGKHVEKALISILVALLEIAVMAMLLLAICTAIGAAIGALAGGVGAAPGAAVGFEVGLAILDWLGLAFLVTWAADAVVRIGSAFATFFSSVWNARGDSKKLDQAARELAEAIGVLAGVIVEALVMWASAKGVQAALKVLKGTAVERAFGESQLGSWLRERVTDAGKGKSPRENLESGKNKEQPKTGGQEKARTKPAEEVPGWPPKAPQGKKPKLGAKGAAEWRYERYRHQQFKKGRKQEDLLDFETYKRRHYKAASEGGRPGRSGGGNQVKTRQFLEQKEGFQNTETTVLNGKYVDLIKPNEKGGIDYVEVDALLKKGTPIKRLREKLKIELDGLKEGDRLIYIDKLDPAKRIIYEHGEKPSVVDTKTWKD
ncbi:SH3 domain-containing protein [Stigmatella aurantiaca]|uniref:SH3 domain-containing protein n=1 Tax=Stigmatella aurantiaca TaxID=41 RepID=UPI001E500881|nr:SH3 domain-containing protein [Stigmatella aurantiaca]